MNNENFTSLYVNKQKEHYGVQYLVEEKIFQSIFPTDCAELSALHSSFLDTKNYIEHCIINKIKEAV